MKSAASSSITDIASTGAARFKRRLPKRLQSTLLTPIPKPFLFDSNGPRSAPPVSSKHPGSSILPFRNQNPETMHAATLRQGSNAIIGSFFLRNPTIPTATG